MTIYELSSNSADIASIFSMPIVIFSIFGIK